MEQNHIINVVFTEDLVETILENNQSLNGIVILIVVIASLLAIVVLYNLTSINISESEREIATLKVLGFYDSEANSYIYREAIMLTMISIILGLVLGVWLHGFVVDAIEGPGIVFLRTIKPMSFLYATVLTILFSIIMKFVTYRVIQRIDMIEALKSVE